MLIFIELGLRIPSSQRSKHRLKKKRDLRLSSPESNPKTRNGMNTIYLGGQSWESTGKEVGKVKQRKEKNQLKEQRECL